MKDWLKKAWANVKKNVPTIVREFPYSCGAIALVFFIIGFATGAKVF